MPAQNLLALLPVAIIVLSLAMVAVVSSYAPLLKWFFDYRKDEKNYKDAALREAQTIIDAARKQAEEIVLAAGKQAEENIKNINLMDDNLKKQSDDLLRELSVKRNDEVAQLTQQYINEYRSFFDSAKNEDIAKLKTTADAINSKVNELLSDLDTTIKEEAKQYIKIIQNRLDESDKSIQSDLNSYKKHQLELLSDRVYEIITQVIAKNVAKTLSPDEHKALIMKSLEEVKNNNGQVSTS